MPEYKVLGRGTVMVGGTHKSLADSVEKNHVNEIEGILNALGHEGWELISLQPPFVFKRETAPS